MATLTFTEGVYAAFSPAKLAVTTSTSETSLAITVKTEADVTLVTITREFFSNAFEVDMSDAVMRYLFANTLTEVGSNPVAKVYLDFLLHCPFKLTIPVWGGTYQKYTAINATLQPGVAEGTFMTTWRNKILTKFAKLYWWPGYTEYTRLAVLVGKNELDMTFVVPGTDVVRSLDSADITYDRVVSVELNPGAVPTEITLSGAADSIVVEEKCIPNSPCFIRWINDIGGWDSWLFSGKQVYTSELSDQEFFRKRVGTNAELANNIYMIAGARADTLKVGVQGLSALPLTAAQLAAKPGAKPDAEVLKQIVFSPYIQLLDPIAFTWSTLTISKASPMIDTGESLQAFEIDFNLPVRQVQNV